jgi:predicted ATPase
MLIIEGAYVPKRSHRPGKWPFIIPSIRQVAEKEIEFENPITLFVGEDGLGNSTLIQALAEGFGLDDLREETQSVSLLGEALKLELGSAVSEKGTKEGYRVFLTAETAYGINRQGGDDLQVLREHCDQPGLVLLDEPEAPLSHLPLLAAIPGVEIWEVHEDGTNPVPWEDLDLVFDWYSYIQKPEKYLGQLLAPEPG